MNEEEKRIFCEKLDELFEEYNKKGIIFSKDSNTEKFLNELFKIAEENQNSNINP